MMNCFVRFWLLFCCPCSFQLNSSTVWFVCCIFHVQNYPNICDFPLHLDFVCNFLFVCLFVCKQLFNNSALTFTTFSRSFVRFLTFPLFSNFPTLLCLFCLNINEVVSFVQKFYVSFSVCMCCKTILFVEFLVFIFSIHVYSVMMRWPK